MRSLVLLFLFAIALFTTSCRKGELPEAKYYSKIQVFDLPFANSPDIEIHFGGKVLGTIKTDKDAIFDVLTAKDTLKIFKANTDTLLADTLIDLSPNAGQTFRFAYSPDLGLQGFIASAGTVGQDTMAFQVLNNLTDYYKTTYPKGIEMHIAFYNYETGNFDETGIVIDNFMDGKLYPNSYKLPLTDAVGFLYIYMGRIVDKATGEYVDIPGSGGSYFIFPYGSSGATYIFNISDDGSGFITMNTIQL